MRARKRAFTLVELIIVLAIIAILAVLAVPNLLEARKYAHQGAAVATMRTLTSAETLFREADEEKDQNFDYGTLAELSATNLVDGVLGSGSKNGYLYGVDYSQSTSEFLWYAVANPALGGITGDLYFATNQRGVVYFTFDHALAVNNVDAAIDPDLIPLNAGGAR